MKTTILILLFGFGFAPAMSQVLDLLTFRGADFSDVAKTSVDFGVVVGDGDLIGARVNWKAGENVLVMGDLGLAEAFDDEIALGGGAMFKINTGMKVDTALKATIHTLLDSDADVIDASVLGIASKDIEGVKGLEWYGNVGLHYVDVDVSVTTSVPNFSSIFGIETEDITVSSSDNDVVLTFGGGINYEFNQKYEGFAGLDILVGDLYDDVVFGLGGRVNF